MTSPPANKADLVEPKLAPSLDIHFYVSNTAFPESEILRPDHSVHKKKGLDWQNKPRKVKYEHFYKAERNLALDFSFKILYDMRNIPILA